RRLPELRNPLRAPRWTARAFGKPRYWNDRPVGRNADSPLPRTRVHAAAAAYRPLFREVAATAHEPSTYRRSGRGGDRSSPRVRRVSATEELALKLRRHVVRMCS